MAGCRVDLSSNNIKGGRMAQSLGKSFMPDLNAEISVKDSFVHRYLSKGPITVFIIYEDSSFKKYKLKLKDAYFFTIRGKKYNIVSKAFLFAPEPMVMYYFNNPMPLFFQHTISQLTAKAFRDPQEFEKLPLEEQVVLSKIILDSTGIDAAFSSSLMKSFYAENKFTTKSLIIIAVVVLVVVLLGLQLTGTVDVMGQISRMAGGAG